MVVVLFIAGDHVPVIAVEFVEFVGKAGIANPAQNGPTGLKVGVMAEGITIVAAAEIH